MTSLFCFGMGYSALELARRLRPRGWTIAGTSMSAAGQARLQQLGYDATIFDGTAPVAVRDASTLDERLRTITHAVMSVPPGVDGDPVLRHCAQSLATAPHLQWIGYLSTIGVYGDHNGGWVDEQTLPTPGSERSQRRVAAENDWLGFGASTGKRVQIFRLAGIYGPGRSAIDNVLDGSARRIIKPGQVFNRTHVADIAAVLDAAINRPVGETVFNVTDDEPAPPQDVIAYAAALMGVPVPPDIDFNTAEFSPMGRSFYSENKRVRNDRIKAILGVALRYPSYREGLAAIAKAMR